MTVYETCPECQSDRVTVDKSSIKHDNLTLQCHTCGLVYNVAWKKEGAVKNDSYSQHSYKTN